MAVNVLGPRSTCAGLPLESEDVTLARKAQTQVRACLRRIRRDPRGLPDRRGAADDEPRLARPVRHQPVRLRGRRRPRHRARGPSRCSPTSFAGLQDRDSPSRFAHRRRGASSRAEFGFQSRTSARATVIVRLVGPPAPHRAASSAHRAAASRTGTRPTSTTLIGSVHLVPRLFRRPSTRLRERFEALVRASPPSGTGRPVAGCRSSTSDRQTMSLRGIMSARSRRGWDLRCAVREQMIAWLQEAHPDALPQVRARMLGGGGPAGGYGRPPALGRESRADPCCGPAGPRAGANPGDFVLERAAPEGPLPPDVRERSPKIVPPVLRRTRRSVSSALARAHARATAGTLAIVLRPESPSARAPRASTAPDFARPFGPPSTGATLDLIAWATPRR